MRSTVMREFPQSVRVAVLDSPLPPDADPFSEQTSHRLSSLTPGLRGMQQRAGMRREISAPARDASCRRSPRSMHSHSRSTAMRLDGAMLAAVCRRQPWKAPTRPKTAAGHQRLRHPRCKTSDSCNRSAGRPRKPRRHRAAREVAHRARPVALGRMQRARGLCTPPRRRIPARTGRRPVCQRLDSQLMDLRKACEVWPVKRASAAHPGTGEQRHPNADLHRRVRSDHPDRLGSPCRANAEALPRATVPGAGHTVAQEPCPMSIIRAALRERAASRRRSSAASMRRGRRS